jgi:hypothetical protein
LSAEIALALTVAAYFGFVALLVGIFRAVNVIVDRASALKGK